MVFTPIKSSQKILKLMVLLYTVAFGTKMDCRRLLSPRYNNIALQKIWSIN